MNEPKKQTRSFKKDESGAALVEFAFVAPVLLLVIMGMLDVGHRIYSTAILQGAIQKAGRDAALDDGSANATAIDDRVKDLMGPILPKLPTIQGEDNPKFTRQNYSDFSDVGEAEEYTDTNGDDVCNNGEAFIDVNGNDMWDADRGVAGQGNAKDAVLYTAQFTYPRLFPMAGILGLPETQTVVASTVLRNQPFGEQTDREEAKQCV